MKTQAAFQDALTQALTKAWRAGHKRAWCLILNNSCRRLERLGYTPSQARAVVDDARDMADLELDCTDRSEYCR